MNNEYMTPGALQVAKVAADQAGRPLAEWVELAVMSQQAADQRAEELRRDLANMEKGAK